MPGTAADFWRMVFDLKVPAIVMVTNVHECGINKCAQYFPAQVNSNLRLPGLELQVWCWCCWGMRGTATPGAGNCGSFGKFWMDIVPNPTYSCVPGLLPSMLFMCRQRLMQTLH